jgi:hypothetical protein
MAWRKLFCPSSYKTGPGLPGSSAKPKLALEPGSGNRTMHGKSAESVDADAALRCLPAFVVLARLLARQAAAEAVQQKFKLEASMDKEASDDL